MYWGRVFYCCLILFEWWASWVVSGDMVECSCSSCELPTVLWSWKGWPCKEMSWHYSLVQSVEQFVVTQLRELGSSRLNMDALSGNTSGLSTHLCLGILWLYWNATWKTLVYLCQLYQLVVQHLEWLITTQDVVRVLILVLLLLRIMSNPLFPGWLWNHLS